MYANLIIRNVGPFTVQRRASEKYKLIDFARDLSMYIDRMTEIGFEVDVTSIQCGTPDGAVSDEAVRAREVLLHKLGEAMLDVHAITARSRVPTG